jgi:predicted dehydrogenase
VKVLVAGLGGIGQRHVRNLRTLLGDGVEIIAYRVRRLPHVVTPELAIEPSADVETRYRIRSFSDLDAALAERPQIAFITNPSSMHVEVATACALAGCDLFIEKPLADSTLGLDALIDLAEARGLVAMVGYQLRFHPGIARLFAIVRSGVLGRLLSVRATVGEYLPHWHRYEDYRTMYAARAELGGGVILSQIHELDYLTWMFGAPVRLFALGGHWSELDVDVEDTASILMECVHGGRALPVHLEQDYVQRPPSRACEVVGDRGKALLDLVQPSVVSWDERGEAHAERFEKLERNQLFLDELAHFLSCVASRERPLVDLRAGRESLRVALAAKESIRTHDVVALNREAASHAG